MTTFRLPGRGRVDHGKSHPFTFDGKSLARSRAGDTTRLGAARERRPP